MDRKENRRSVFGMLVRPKEQMRHAVSTTILSVVVAVVLLICVGVSFNSMVGKWKETQGIDPEITRLFETGLVPVFALIAFTMILMAVLVMFLMVRSSHRFYGPLVPIQRHIANLTNGNFKSRLVLREGDELQELRESLNKLAEALQAGKGS